MINLPIPHLSLFQAIYYSILNAVRCKHADRFYSNDLSFQRLAIVDSKPKHEGLTHFFTSLYKSKVTLRNFHQHAQILFQQTVRRTKYTKAFSFACQENAQRYFVRFEFCLATNISKVPNFGYVEKIKVKLK